MKALSDLPVQYSAACLESRIFYTTNIPIRHLEHLSRSLFFSFLLFFLSFYLYSSFYFGPLFVSFSLSSFACRAWPHTYPFIVLSQTLFILLFLCHLKQGRNSGGQKLSQWVHAIYGQTPQDESHLDFVLHSFVRAGVWENALLLLHRRVIDAGAFDISHQMKYTITLSFNRHFFRDPMSSKRLCHPNA